MKFQDDMSNINTHTHTHTSRNQYVPHFFKVGGIKRLQNQIADMNEEYFEVNFI